MYKIKKFLPKPFIYILFISLGIFFLFPVVYMLISSFKSNWEVSAALSPIYSDNLNSGYAKLNLIPQEITLLQYYRVLFLKPKYLLLFLNSIKIVIPVLSGQLIISTLAAYGYGKFNFPFKNLLFTLYILLMMMPFQVTLVPNYIIMRNFELLNTHWSIIFPGIFSTFGVFLLKQFISMIPEEYCEAARIDGIGNFRMLPYIILPQCKGAFASLCILVFVDNWNLVEQPLIFLRDESLLPLSLIMDRINQTDLIIAFACGFMYMLPTILIFLYGKEYLIQGVQMSGIK